MRGPSGRFISLDKTEDVIRHKFNELTVVKQAGPFRGKSTILVCSCSCGKLTTATYFCLTKNRKKSCGCLKDAVKEKIGKVNYRHGKMNTRVYTAWAQMMGRCYNKNNGSYARYGGRGIFVDEPWHDFVNFYADMGDKPAGMLLERIDNNRGYSVDNCRWASAKDQSRNRRSSKLITFMDRTLTLAAWAEFLCINYGSLWSRLQRGMSVEDAFTRPILENRPITKRK